MEKTAHKEQLEL